MPDGAPLPYRRLAPVLLMLAALPVTGAARLDEYRESVFDGAWAGTASLGPQTLPLALVLNVDSMGGVAAAVSFDDTGALLAAPAEVTAVTSTGLELSIEDPGGGPAIELTLRYRSTDDSLSGTVAMDAGSTVQLRRMSPDSTLQRLWSGRVKVAGQSQALVLQLQEDDAARGRAIEVRGNFWVDGEHGTVVGTRNGTSFDLQLDADGTPFIYSGRISKGLQLKGKLSGEGQSVNAKLVAAPGKGKPAKLTAPNPATLEAGATQMVAIRGKNFAPGTLVEFDDPAVTVGEVAYRSAKLLDVTVAVDDSVADGTVVGLRALGSDGQLPERRDAFAVEGGGGGTTVSFAASVQPIFTASCATSGCHAGNGQAGLVLSAGVAYQNLVNVPSSEQPSLLRVQPGNAEASYLVRKIRGDPGISGGQMPLNRSPLGAEQIALIVDWINQGAASNRPSR